MANPTGLRTLWVIVFVLLGGCSSAFDLQGHRGARGLAPENTLPAFAAALTIGVSTLELDVGVSADGTAVVSHDPVLNAALTRKPDGSWLRRPGPALFNLSDEEIRRYDVGRINPSSGYARRYPVQRAVDGTRIPNLSAVFDLVRRAGNDVVRFNIETKLKPTAPERTPAPAAFARAVLTAVRDAGMEARVTVQSFDWRTLQMIQRDAPQIPTVYLSVQQGWLDNIQRRRPGASPWTAGLDVDDHGGSIPKLVKAAGGSVWSPYHEELDRAQLQEAHGLGLRVVVWTVNDPDRMEALIELGVDGIITDYPDRLRTVMARRGMALPQPTPVKP